MAPQKLRHNPVAWSVTVYATALYQLGLQYAIAKCNWTLIQYEKCLRRRVIVTRNQAYG